MNEERAREGLVHLQAAAIELIEAARAFLDVAEEMVQNPSEFVELATVVANKVTPPGPPPEAGPEPRVERIRVS